MTGGLDEITIKSIKSKKYAIEQLDLIRKQILHRLIKQGILTDELKEKILAAQSRKLLEDIFEPIRPKHKTPAMIATEKGLEPLAKGL